MDLSAAIADVAGQVGAAERVVPRGGGCHWEVGGPAPEGTEVRAPAGVVAYEPADMTVTVGAGTTAATLDDVLAEHGQECVLDAPLRAPGEAPGDATSEEPGEATVGGVLAVGLSGIRRLGHGPLRDRVLEVRFARADGAVVRAGGPTVKNVSGYDVVRLLVGSFGTLGVLLQVTLRTQPRPAATRWMTSSEPPDLLSSRLSRRRLFRPSALLWDGTRTAVLLEGHPDDLTEEIARGGLTERSAPPAMPTGPHRGRISLPPARLGALASRLHDLDLRWLAEGGIGTVHLAADHPAALAGARDAAHAEGGWLLREAGAPGLDGFGVALPNAAIMGRVKAALDPTGKLNPGRLPYPVTVEA